jgi:hypothetical protein
MKKGYIYYLHIEIMCNGSNETDQGRVFLTLSLPAGKCMKSGLKQIRAVYSPLLCRPSNLSIPRYKISEADTALLNNSGTNGVVCGFVA